MGLAAFSWHVHVSNFIHKYVADCQACGYNVMVISVSFQSFEDVFSSLQHFGQIGQACGRCARLHLQRLVEVTALIHKRSCLAICLGSKALQYNESGHELSALESQPSEQCTFKEMACHLQRNKAKSAVAGTDRHIGFQKLSDLMLAGCEMRFLCRP